MKESRKLTHRIAALDDDLCQPRKCGLECIVYCPVNKSDGGECIVQRPKDGKAVISEDLCTGCGICVKKCPFEAIVIVNLVKELGEHKIHQFGINSFRIYRLPTFRRGSVVGLLGRNGIGKSTVLNILSGNIRPNFGSYETDLNWGQVIKNFHGTDLSSHFEKIADKTIRVSIKPQLVTLIPKIFKGTAKELLRKYDERNKVDELMADLDLKEILDQDIEELSGGQLQRLAIAVAAAKDADYYFFDEPSSYNDVYQRIAVARVIHDLAAEEQKKVMVAEHDLALLDYISDYIYIIYGEPSAYGIVSSLYSTKTGINSFLEGFIQIENTRFREKAFLFDIKTELASNTVRDDPIAGYSDMIKSFSSFKLKVSSGHINRGEIVGVLGANAIGKTTFMRMLAGVMESDSGNIDIGRKISYKAQYLVQDYDGTVKSLLTTAYGSAIEGSPIEALIVVPLGIKKIYEKNVRKISGGELQKVAITASLMRDADIYALDEPSAFLDVEDRITIAKFLQHFIRSQGKSAIIIEHDLQLIDIVSDSLIIFEGVPGSEGFATSPMSKKDGMNRFLKVLSVTYRRDETTGRPRINKDGSRLDREQKDSGEYYYINI